MQIRNELVQTEAGQDLSLYRPDAGEPFATLHFGDYVNIGELEVLYEGSVGLVVRCAKQAWI